MFDRLINDVESEVESERSADLETMKAMWKVIETWRDMSKMRQSVKFDYESFCMAVGHRMWEE